MDELSQTTGLIWPDIPVETDPTVTSPVPDVLPANGRFAGSYTGYVVIPETLLSDVVESTEAELAAFGSYAAMGPYGSFELRRSDVPASTALTTWPGIINFYYASERHFRPILDRMGIPIIPLKRDFLHGYERVITELGQL